MAVITPIYQNAVLYDGETERRGVSAVVVNNSQDTVRTGVLGAGPSITLSGSTINVGAFVCVVGSSKGGYFTGLDGTTSAGNITAANATNPRLDRIILEVIDPDNSKPGTRGGLLRIVPGTAAAVPVLPALPALSIHLGQVSVPASGQGGATVTVNPLFTAAVGAPIPVRNAAERDAITPYPGLLAYRLDTETTDFVDSGLWKDSYVPFPESAGWAMAGGITTSRSAGRVKYHLVGRMTRTISALNIGAVSTDAFTTIITNWLPVTARPDRPLDQYCAVKSSGDLYFGQAVVRITGAGTLLMAGERQSLSMQVGGYVDLDCSWVK